MIVPTFTLDDIRYSEGSAMYARACELFEQGRVADFQSQPYGYSGTVRGTKDYRVVVSAKALDRADCDCYMGQNDQLCKHVLALALKALKRNRNEAESDTKPLTIEEAKLRINAGMKKIKAYSGPSRIWFSYQRSLSVGSSMIIEGSHRLESSLEAASLLWKTVIRLSKKLATGGVDDSDGTVGECCMELIATLNKWAESNDEMQAQFTKFSMHDTGFGFEDELKVAS